MLTVHLKLGKKCQRKEDDERTCLLQGRWLYALLACLEKPLLPEAHSSIRQLARRCAQLRSTLVGFSLHYCPVAYLTIPLPVSVC